MADSDSSSILSEYTDSDDESVPEQQPRIPTVLSNYRLMETLGSGTVHNGAVVALKVQRVDHECPTNRYERYLYPLLQGGKGMPRLFTAGVQGHWDFPRHRSSRPKKSGKDTMDLGSVCSIAMQLISRLETMHTRGVLHRDIQLGNCVIGLPPNEKLIYMIDFGFSKQYIDPHTRRHIEDSRAKRDFIGNYWFSSVNVHCRGRVPSRRDDLEAAALMLIHMLTPRGLSWTRNGVPKTDEAHDRLIAEKQTARPEDLCRGIPYEFEDFLRYCRKLKFMDCQGSTAIPYTLAATRSCRCTRREWRLSSVGLRKLNFGARPVLGDRTNVEEAEKKGKEASGRNLRTGERLNQTFAPRPLRPPTTKSLARLVHNFVKVLQMNSSRTLTKDASRFLDTLYKQLDDPSVFIQPNRVARTRSGDEAAERGSAQAKLGIVMGLRNQLQSAQSNKAVAKLVEDFAKVTNKSVGRTITKDGFLFLEGVAQRLQALH
ncbi:CK1/CK1 protein kinase [Ephemerocybe angulata]|uniref:CK1/CK1 protein kinase n=1 Tax=Ephemerocybe angulata TaxID=980116 RepID=A0A8H6I299_9AGAR|nr:CK1/CK1 protein kinase [Tulosesus angulatus]